VIIRYRPPQYRRGLKLSKPCGILSQ